MDQDEWRGIRRDANRGVSWGLVWTLIIISIVVVLGVVWWALSVAASGPKGQGDGVIENNSSENWIAAQARFEDLHEGILASDRKIQVAYDDLLTDPDNATLKTNYSSMRNLCINNVGHYNAESRKFLSEDWKSAGLPDRIDNTNPKTDCKENQE